MSISDNWADALVDGMLQNIKENQRDPDTFDDAKWERERRAEPLPDAEPMASNNYNPDQPRERGRWVSVTSALRTANPFPQDKPPDIPGLGNPKMLAENPTLRKAAEAHAAHTAAYHQAYTADTIHRLLSRRRPENIPVPGEGISKGERVSTAKRAIRRVGDATEDMVALGPLYEKYQDAVIATHPDGRRALAAAQDEATRRHGEAMRAAQAHISQLPEYLQDKANKMLTRARGF